VQAVLRLLHHPVAPQAALPEVPAGAAVLQVAALPAAVAAVVEVAAGNRRLRYQFLRFRETGSSYP